MDIKIVFHPSGDWEGLYIDGVLGPEGHSISIDEFVDVLYLLIIKHLQIIQ
jgi:hypothetical protein